MKKLLLALALFLLPAAASAQCTGVFPASTTCGSVAGGVAGPIPFSTFTGLVASVTAADGTLTISPNVGAVIAGINLGNANTWSATQTFPNSTIALAKLVVGTQDTVLGYFTSTTATASGLTNCTTGLTYSTSTHTFGCAGTPLSSIQLSNGKGISIATTAGANPCVATCNLTVNQSLTNATLNASPGNPTNTTSTVGVMMGLGTTCVITPIYSTRILIHIQGQVTNTTTGISATVTLRFGTGTAPVNGAALTGNVLTPGIVAGANPANYSLPFNVGGITTGLTVGQAVWFDVSLAAGANTAAMSNLSCYAMEF